MLPSSRNARRRERAGPPLREEARPRDLNLSRPAKPMHYGGFDLPRKRREAFLDDLEAIYAALKNGEESSPTLREVLNRHTEIA